MNRRRVPASYPPSVGELLDRANLLARDLLHDAPERDGRAMLRAWGEAVEQASVVWRQLPHRSDVPGTARDVIDQLERSARTLHRSAGGGIDVDPTLLEIGQNLTHAGELITGSGAGQRPGATRWTDAHLRDAFAARVNIMHTLYVATHAVSVGLGQNARAEQVDARLRVHKTPSAALQQRILDLEQLAHSYLDGHYPHALAGRLREPVDDTRIAGAISTWDVHAQRALAQDPTADTMARVAGSVFAASTHVHRLWRTAAAAGHVDLRTFDTDIAPQLETMIEKWGEAHTLFKNLIHPHDVSPLPLRQATAELGSALRDVTMGPIGPVATEDIHQRVDMATLVRSLHRFHATAASVAGTFSETTRTAPLLVDARAAHNLIKATPEEDQPLSAQNATHCVAPTDVVWKRAIPLPLALREQAVEIGNEVSTAARASLRTTLAASDQQATTLGPARLPRTEPGLGRLTQSQNLERRQLSPVRDIPGAGPRR